MRIIASSLALSSGIPSAIASAVSRLMFTLMMFSSSDSSSSDILLTARSNISTRLGNVSLNRPLILSVTSILGLPNSDTGITSRSLTLPPYPVHTGRRPISHRMYAMSSPPVFMVSVAHTTMPMALG